MQELVHHVSTAAGGCGAEAAAARAGSLPPGEGGSRELGRPPEPQLCRLRPCRRSGMLLTPLELTHDRYVCSAMDPQQGQRHLQHDSALKGMTPQRLWLLPVLHW